MRIGELSERAGVSRDTIRFYERNGLIKSAPGESATNNYLDYPDENLIRLNFFTRARDAGMSVADLRSIIEATAGSCDREVGRAVIRTKIAELQERVKQTNAVIAFLEKAIARD